MLFLVFLAVTYVAGLVFWVVFCWIPCSLATAISSAVVLCIGLSGWVIGGCTCCCAILLGVAGTLISGFISTNCCGPLCTALSLQVPLAATTCCCLAAVVAIGLLGVASTFLCPMAGAVGAERVAERYYEVVRPAAEGGV